MLKLAPPELVSVRVCALLLPTFTFPKATLVGFTERAGPDTPVPARGIGDHEELLDTEMLPVAVPRTVGAKTAVNVKLCPTDNFTGRYNLLILNSVPVTVTPEMVTVLLP